MINVDVQALMTLLDVLVTLLDGLMTILKVLVIDVDVLRQVNILRKRERLEACLAVHH